MSHTAHLDAAVVAFLVLVQFPKELLSNRRMMTWKVSEVSPGNCPSRPVVLGVNNHSLSQHYQSFSCSYIFKIRFHRRIIWRWHEIGKELGKVMYSGDISGLHFNLCGYFLSATATLAHVIPLSPRMLSLVMTSCRCHLSSRLSAILTGVYTVLTSLAAMKQRVLEVPKA